MIRILKTFSENNRNMVLISIAALLAIISSTNSVKECMAQYIGEKSNITGKEFLSKIKYLAKRGDLTDIIFTENTLGVNFLPRKDKWTENGVVFQGYSFKSDVFFPHNFDYFLTDPIIMGNRVDKFFDYLRITRIDEAFCINKDSVMSELGNEFEIEIYYPIFPIKITFLVNKDNEKTMKLHISFFNPRQCMSSLIIIQEPSEI